MQSPRNSRTTSGEPVSAPGRSRPGPAPLTLAADPGTTPVPARMRQIDALRGLTCLSVIACHVIGNVYRPERVEFAVGTLLLHYSREIFFFVSALVLVRTYVPRLDAEGRLPRSFRRRRLWLVGLPYLSWTAVYAAVTFAGEPHEQPVPEQALALIGSWVYRVLHGSGWYHLYFLTVTLQFTVVFPLFLRLLRRHQGRHVRLLVWSYAAQVVLLTVFQLFGIPIGPLRMVAGGASLITYQLWFIAGGVVGLHLDRVHTWLLDHRGLVLGALPLAGVALLANYWVRVPAVGPGHASSPFQPLMAVWSTAVFGALYLLADRLSRARSGLVARLVDHGARLSFGIFLAHPLVLALVLSSSRRAGVFSASPATVAVAFVLTLGGTVALCALLARTPLSLASIGRPREPRPGTSARPDTPASPGAVR